VYYRVTLRLNWYNLNLCVFVAQSKTGGPGFWGDTKNQYKQIMMRYDGPTKGSESAALW